jgi:hypothetical protein
MPLGSDLEGPPQRDPFAADWLVDAATGLGSIPKIPGASLTPSVRLPFNSTAFQEAVSQADLDWERKRGTSEYEEWRRKQLAKLELVPGNSSSISKASTGSNGGQKDRSARRLLL